MICLTELLLYAKSLLVILLFYQKVIDTCNCQNDLNSEWESISNWAYQWKLQFNLIIRNKQMKLFFSRKSNTYMYPPVKFNNNTITKSPHQRYLDVILNFKLGVNIHIEQKIKTCNMIIGLVRRHLYDKQEN